MSGRCCKKFTGSKVCFSDGWREDVFLLGGTRATRRRGLTLPHFRYRLIDEAGKDLGQLTSPRSLWSVGERVSRWHGDDLEIVAVVEAERHDPFRAYLVVRGL